MDQELHVGISESNEVSYDTQKPICKKEFLAGYIVKCAMG